MILNGDLIDGGMMIKLSRTKNSKTIGLLLLMFGVIFFCFVWVSAQTMNKAEPNRITREPALRTAPQISPGLKMVADDIDMIGGKSESDHFKMQISAGGQPSAIGISQSDSCKLLAGYVYAAFIFHGDANADGKIDVGDVVSLINYLYKNGPAPKPLEAGDANCDGIIDVGDVVFLINYLFKKGPPPCDPLK